LIIVIRDPYTQILAAKQGRTTWKTVLPFTVKRIICHLLCLQIAFCAVDLLYAQGTAFTYQGQLYSNGGVANGSYDLAFTVYDSTNFPGSVIAGPVTNTAVVVSNGLFATILDFGTGVFTGPARWLQIAVSVTGTTNFITLSPRQPLTAVPYTIFANTASNLVGTLTASAFVGYTNSVALTNGANLFNGTFSGSANGLFTGNGSGLTNLSMAAIPSSMSTNRTFYNVQDWGADATGAIECSQAISNTMAAMPATGGTLYFHGRFWLANSIYITKPMTICGDGSTSITLGTNAYPSPSEITWSMNGNLFVVLATNCTFKDITLNNTNINPTVGSAIFVTNASVWYVRMNASDITINGGWNGIDSEVNEHQVYFGCYFENLRNFGILARNNINHDAGDWRVVGCTFQNHGFTGNAAIHIESSGGVGIFGCKFNYACINDVEVIPASGAGTSIFQAEGNSFENYSGHAIYGVGSDWPYWTITGNEFAGYQSSTYPIYLSGGVGSHSIIDENVFAFATSAAVYFSGETDIHLGSMIIYPAVPRWYDGGGNSQIDDGAVTITTGTISATNFIGNGAGLTNINLTASNLPSSVVINILTNVGWGASGCLNRFTNGSSITSQPVINYGSTVNITNFASASFYNVSGLASDGTLTNTIAGTYNVSFVIGINASSEQKIEVYTNDIASPIGASGYLGSSVAGVGCSIAGFGELTVPQNTRFSLRVVTSSGSQSFDIGSFEIRFIHP